MANSVPRIVTVSILVNVVATAATLLPAFRVSANQQDEAPVDVGRRKQLLVDDYVLSRKSGITREPGSVTKANDGRPIFTEGWFYGTVLHHEGKFKLWFRKPDSEGFGYAESANGLAFKTKADVTGINFAGDYTLAVELDPAESDPRHRFKAAYDAPGMAAGLAHSADGMAWTPYNGGKPVTGRAADTYNQVLWDPQRKTYRLFTRTDFGTPGGTGEIRGTRSMTNADLKADPTNWKVVREWMFDKEGKDEPRRRQSSEQSAHGFDHPSAGTDCGFRMGIRKKPTGF